MMPMKLGTERSKACKMQDDLNRQADRIIEKIRQKALQRKRQRNVDYGPMSEPQQDTPNDAWDRAFKGM